MSPSAFVVHLTAAPFRLSSSPSSFCTRRALPLKLRPASRYATLRTIRACAPSEPAQPQDASPQNGVETEGSDAQPPTQIDAVADEQATPLVDETAEQTAEVPVEVTAEATSEGTADENAEGRAEENAEEPAEETDTDAKPRPEQRRRRRRTRQKREVTLPLEEMTVGMELEGVVKTVMEYGAFIGETGAPTDGLLHVSQLRASFVENVSDVVKVGDKITVRVLSVDLKKGNFSLTMKTAEELESGDTKREAAANRKRDLSRKWDAFSYDDKKFVDAKVISITDFGAFCQLIDEQGQQIECPTDGLIHISEVSEQRVSKVSDVLSIGQSVKVRVVGADRKRNRISLSMKGPNASPRQKQSSTPQDIEEATKNQPVFKTAFELAFEKAEASLSQ